MRPGWLALGARLGLTVGILLILTRFVDVASVVQHLTALEPSWLALALAVTVVQVVVSAWRWRYTAMRIGVDLPLSRAVSEYYLGTFVNQVAPGGVLGDVSRAWRDARRVDAQDDAAVRSIHAVVLERVSGQMVMVLVAVLCMLPLLGGPLSLPGASALSGSSGRTALLVGLPTLVAAAVFAAWLGATIGRRVPAVERFGERAGVALFGDALPVQLGVSAFIVGTYVLVYLLTARALGVATPLVTLAPLVPPVLLAMLLPVTVAGWGLREGAAALVWGAVGLSAAEGVALSIAYGVVVLVSSFPGALVLLRFRGGRAPGRRAGPGRTGSDGRAGVGPGRGVPRREG